MSQNNGGVGAGTVLFAFLAGARSAESSRCSSRRSRARRRARSCSSTATTPGRRSGACRTRCARPRRRPSRPSARRSRRARQQTGAAAPAWRDPARGADFAATRPGACQFIYMDLLRFSCWVRGTEPARSRGPPRAGRTMTNPSHREIPYNYTSADDRQAVSSLLGKGVWKKLEELRERRVTGRSARLLMRVFGEVLVHRRNPYLRQELVTSSEPPQALLRRRRGEPPGHPGRAPGTTPLVLEVLAEARRMLDGVRDEVRRMPDLHARIRRALGAVVGRENVLLDPFTLVAHATDATDWRLHLPLAVVTPTEESQVAPLLAAIRDLGLHAIPRGAGTGPHRRRHPAHARLRDGEHREAEPHPRRLDAHLRRSTTGGRVDGPGGRPRGRRHHRGGHGARHRTAAWSSPPTPPAPGPAPSAATSPRTPAARTASCGAPASTTWSRSASPCPAGTTGPCTGSNHQLRKILFDDVVRFEVRDGAGALVRAHRAPRQRDPQARALEGHHQQGAGRPARACRRRAPTASSPRPSSSSTRPTRRPAPCASSSSAPTSTRPAR